MVKLSQAKELKDTARRMLAEAGVLITDAEYDSMDVADFGHDNCLVEGGQMVTFFCTQRVSAKMLVMLPGQTLPQHWHLSANYGKEETLRVASGTLYMYKDGEDNMSHGKIPEGREQYYTCRNELVMKPTDQITFMPGEKHWFQGGPEGAVVYSFANCAIDAIDPFEDPTIVRVTKYVEG